MYRECSYVLHHSDSLSAKLLSTPLHVLQQSDVPGVFVRAAPLRQPLGEVVIHPSPCPPAVRCTGSVRTCCTTQTASRRSCYPPLSMSSSSPMYRECSYVLHHSDSLSAKLL